METAVLPASDALGMHSHQSRLNDYTFPSVNRTLASAGGPAQPPSAAGQQHGSSGSDNPVASGSRPVYVRRRSAQQVQTYYPPQPTPSGLVAASYGPASTPRSATFPQPVFDPDSPFSQPPPGRTTASPEKQRHPVSSIIRSHSPEPEGESSYWGENALGTPSAARAASRARLEDVVESFAQKEGVVAECDRSVIFLAEEGYTGDDIFDGEHVPIAAIRRERGRGRAVVLDVAPAPGTYTQQAYVHHPHHQPVYDSQYQRQPEPPAPYVPVASPSRVYAQHQPPVHHRGQSDDRHNRHPYRPAPTTPASYHVPTLKTSAPTPGSPGVLLDGRHQPRVISPLPGGSDWGQFVHAELFEEGNSQEEIVPFGGQSGDGGDGTVEEHGQAPPPQQPLGHPRTSSAHAFHHPRPRPVMSAHDLEPTPVLEPHSDTSPTFSLSSRSQPGTPASFSNQDYADHHHQQSLHLSVTASSSYTSSSSSSGVGSQYQFASAQPYNPATLDSFNPAQMHLPPSSFTFTSTAPPPPTTRVPDYRSHRRIKSIESVMSDYGPIAGQPDHETIPEEYDDSFGPSDASGGYPGSKDDYALNDLVKQVHLQHGGQSLYRARTESASRPSTASRAPSPAEHYRAHSTEQPSPYSEHRPYSRAPGPYGPPAYTSQHLHGKPVILVPHGRPPPPGMVPIHGTSYTNDPGRYSDPADQYLRPYASQPIAPSPGFQPTFSGSTSPYPVQSPVMGHAGPSETASSHYAHSPVVDAPPPPPPPQATPAAPSKETLAVRRRNSKRGGSLSLSISKSAKALQPLSFSPSDLSASTSSTFQLDETAADSVHYHPYSRPSSSQPASSSAAPSSASKPSRKRRSVGGARSKKAASMSASGAGSSRAVDKSAMAALIETLYEPLDGENAGSESASPPPTLDYDTATGGKGKGKEELKFRCLVEDCDRAFPRRSAIIHHIQMHLSDKPYVCPVPGCNASFVRQHDLRRHERIHSETKQFNCPCGKGFTRGDALVRHRQRGICVGSTMAADSP